MFGLLYSFQRLTMDLTFIYAFKHSRELCIHTTLSILHNRDTHFAVFIDNNSYVYVTRSWEMFIQLSETFSTDALHLSYSGVMVQLFGRLLGWKINMLLIPFFEFQHFSCLSLNVSSNFEIS